MNKKTVITIGRQFGSGGRQVGRRIADELGVPFYDKELLAHAAKESGMAKELFENYDEAPTNSLLYSLSMGAYSMGNLNAAAFNLPLNHKVFLAQFDAIKKLAEQGGCVIVGRCADYALANYPHLVNVFIYADIKKRAARVAEYEGIPLKEAEERAQSRSFFDAQLSLAEELNLPAIVHDRDAHRDTLDIVRAHPGARGVFHCCALGPEDVKTALDLGWMISFTGNITFHNARRAPEILRWLPLDRLMLETDAPYMAPEPYRGKRCDSSMIACTARRVAEIRGVSAEEILSVTLENGKRFFGIETKEC